MPVTGVQTCALPIFGIPAIVKLNDGTWGVIVGNGLNNTGSGQSGIFILDAATGAVKRKIMTGLGSLAAPNGIAGITPVDHDGNGTVDYVYAGDIYGRMWKFDLTANNSAGWSVAYGGAPLYRAQWGGADQPITAAPEVARHPTHGDIVVFGTGMYLQVSDISDTTQQTVYGIWDDGVPVAGIANLQVQAVSGTVNVTAGLPPVTRTYRTVTANPINWSIKKGWYLNLPTSGERVAVDLLIRDGRVLVTSLLPNVDLCAAGGFSWLMELDYQTGGQFASSVFDTNADGSINTTDVNLSGVQLDGIASTPAVLSGFGPNDEPGSVDNLYLNLSTGGIGSQNSRGNPLANRRMSWRQLR